MVLFSTRPECCFLCLQGSPLLSHLVCGDSFIMPGSSSPLGLQLLLHLCVTAEKQGIRKDVPAAWPL